MRVGIHCLCTYPSYSGGTNSFTFGLLDGFARAGGAHDFQLFVAPWNREIFERYEGVAHFELVVVDEPVSRPRRILGRVLRTAKPSGNDRTAHYARVIGRRADVLYVPYVPPIDYFPFPDVPTVFSIHDIQHVHYPEFFTAAEIEVRDVSFASCVEHAAAIQASSRSMAREFCDHFPQLAEDDVAVIPEGVDVERFARPRSENDVTARYGLPESFLFTPAQLWPHKNHLTILRTLKRLGDRGLVVPLVLTGAEYGAARDVLGFIAEQGLDEQVFHLGVVPFEDVIALHQAARFLVTASLYESSSLPILEAAAAGTPIIASRIPSHEEMAEHLQMRLFAATDDAALAGVLEEAWASDEATIAAQVAANREGVLRYTWDNAARMYIQLFERLQREKRARP